MEQLPSIPPSHQVPSHHRSSLPPRADFETHGPQAGPDMQFIGRVLAGRKWMIASIVALTTGLTAVAVSKLPDQYASEALLLVENRNVRIVRETDQVLNAIPAEDAAILSEVEILKSEKVLDQVIADLNLAANPEFVPRKGEGDEAKTPLSRTLLAWGWDATHALWGNAPPALVADALKAGEDYVNAPPAVPPVPVTGQSAVREHLRKELDATIVGRSRVIRVAYTSRDPNLSAQVVDSVVRHYMDTRRQMDNQMASNAVQVLRDRIATLNREVQELDQQAEQQRFASGLLRGQTGTNTIAVQELERTRLQLAEASTNRARLVAQAEALERNLRAGDWNAIGGSIVSPVVGQLRANVATLQTELAQVSKQYGPLHPRVNELQARLGQANGALQNEIRREINGVREAASVAVAQEAALKTMIERSESAYAASLSNDGVKLRALEAEATAKRQLLDSLMGRLEELEAQQDNRAYASGVKLVSAAQVPDKASGPFRLALVMAGFAASVFLAIGFVFALELMQRRVRSPDALRRHLGVSGVHVVPHHVGARRKTQLHTVFQTHPFSLFSESMRALYRNHLSDVGPVGAIAVTSARPRDGKTALSLTVAQVASQAGRRVVVVDTDFRRPRVDEIFGLGGKAGLSDWIDGAAALDDVVQYPDGVPFAVIPAGGLNSTTLDRFNVPCVEDLMAALSPHFDLVVFDTAPVLAVSDARVVCAAASKVMFVSRWGHTTANDLQAVAELGPIDHGKFVAVLTDVDLKKAASRGYAGPYKTYLASRNYYGMRA
ncbi:uncharacterized protein involved in exopolysaccharide biosynthesis/Mrp family chromosome partitioning ATPase [Azospirillum fermentarium]|uniref:GumC family protein n=1 Tax=Azospirillum fermentarium TaxID=1233114 RepID=UPI0022269CF4|nr:polysaccharide biosynthesis tyrosine autokinase [Azospirillum fermentarium]MCW2247416.1 uncharacterized protein involved in exopolysaccharide biosynthesis/Mrp family chromosome partitioning ATPase [Azospirillum fermentarium]